MFLFCFALILFCFVLFCSALFCSLRSVTFFYVVFCSDYVWFVLFCCVVVCSVLLCSAGESDNVIGAENARGTPGAQGDHHAAREQLGHGDATPGRGPDQHVQEAGEVVLWLLMVVVVMLVSKVLVLVLLLVLLVLSHNSWPYFSRWSLVPIDISSHG